MKTVLVFGTFDIIHPGHQWFLRNASEYGDKLVAVVSRDSFVLDWKGKSTIKDEKSRIQALKDSGLVDDAVLADPRIRSYGIIKEIQPDIICLGHDQKALLKDLQNWLNKTGNSQIHIEVLPPWKRRKYSSTKLNKALSGAGINDRLTGLALNLLLITAMLIFGFSWISGKRISSSAPPLTLSFLRFVLTTLFFIPLSAANKTTFRIGNRKGWFWTVASALSLISFNIFFFQSLTIAPAGTGGLIVTTLNPFFTFLIVSFSLKKPIGKIAATGIVLGIIGILLYISPLKFNLPGISPRGIYLFFAAALSWSLLTIFSRKALADMDFRSFNLGLYLMASIILLPFALHPGFWQIFRDSDYEFWIDMLILSGAAGAFGTGIYFLSYSKLGPVKNRIYTYIVPVSAIIYAFVFLGETPSPLMISGGIFTLCAVIIIYKQP